MMTREYVNVSTHRIAEYEALGYAVVAHVARGLDWEAVLMMREAPAPELQVGSRLDMSAVLEPRAFVPPALRWLLALALLIWLAAASC